MDDQTNTQEEEKKKQYGAGDILVTLGALGYVFYENNTPEGRRRLLHNAWVRDYQKALIARNPQLKKLNGDQERALNQYVRMLLVRGDSALLEKQSSSPQLAQLHDSVIQYVPELEGKITPESLHGALQTTSGVYGQESKKIEERMGEERYRELRTSERYHESRDRMRGRIRTVTTLSSKERGALFDHLDAALKEGKDPATYIPEQYAHIAQTLSQTWQKDTALHPILVEDSRTRVFSAVTSALEKQLNDTVRSKELAPEIKRFAYQVVAVRRDELFTAKDSQQQVRGMMSIEALLKQFPQLRNLVSGARILEAQNSLAQQYAQEYEHSMQNIATEPQKLNELRAQEDSDLLLSQYQHRLERAGISPEEIARRTATFSRAAHEELLVDRTGKNLLTRIEKKITSQEGSAYRDEGFAFNNTLAWYASQPELQRRIESPITVPDHTPLPRAVLRTLEERISVTPTPIAQMGQPIANVGSRIVGRIFTPRSFVRSAVTRGAQSLAQKAAVTAARTPAAWPVIAIVAASIIIGIMFIMLMDTNTMLAAAPYAVQQSGNATYGTTVVPSPTIPEVPHAVTTVTIPTGPVPTLPASFPSLITQGYDKPGTTWEELNPNYNGQTVLPVQGYVTWYGQEGFMAEVAANRTKWGQITPCEECIGDISLLRFGDINRRVWIRRTNGTVEGPYRVVDCAAKHDVATILNKRIGNYRWIADLSHEIAADWNFTSEVVVIMDTP